MVALLRAVNVGGTGKIGMADLRAVATACGHTDVRSYIQSGNLVFATEVGDPETVAAGLEAAIAAAGDVRPAVIVRTRKELASVVTGNPYVRRGEDPTHLHAVFYRTPEEASIRLPDIKVYAPEKAVAKGRERYLLLPGGMGRSKLAVDLNRGAGGRGTARNWRTVTKLLEMAGEG